MKLESGSAPRVSKWRLKRTLRRWTDFRQITPDDGKYLWAAYKKGGLKGMGIPSDLDPEQFRAAFDDLVGANCHEAWMLLAVTSRGIMPVGIVLAAWAPLRTFLTVLGIAWMPWATKRNIVESCVGFFDSARKKHSLVGYALNEHKKMYDVCAMHGIMRRVGTSYITIPGQHCAVYETRPAQ